MLSFNSALVLKPSDTDSLRLMITRGTQLPSLNTSGAFLVDTRYVKISGDPFINPMTVTNYELGWDHGLAGPHLPVRVSAFHQNNQDPPGDRGWIHSDRQRNLSCGQQRRQLDRQWAGAWSQGNASLAPPLEHRLPPGKDH